MLLLQLIPGTSAGAFERLKNRSIVIEQHLHCLGLLETLQDAHGADLDIVHGDFVALQLSSQNKRLVNPRPVSQANQQVWVL